MRPVTDPALLAQLEGGPQLKPVTDPALLAQLEGGQQEPAVPVNTGGIAARGSAFDQFANSDAVRAVTDNSVARGLAGIGGGLLRTGVGAIQAGAQLVGADGIAQAAGRANQDITNTVNTKLGTVGKVGDVAGQVAPFLLAPTAAATTLGRVALGGGAGAVQGFTQAQDTPDMQKRVQSAATGAAWGAAGVGAVEGAIKLARAGVAGTKAAAAGYAARSAEQLDASAQALKQQSSELYKASREAGAVLNKPRAVSIANKVQAAIEDSGKLNDRLHGDTLGILKDFKQAVRKGPISLEELDQYRQLFSSVVQKNTTKLEGSNPDAMKALQAIDAIDSMVNSLGKTDIVGGKTQAVQLLQQARQQWGTYRQFEKIADVVRNADGDPNRLKAGLQRLANNKMAMRGFPETVRKSIKDAARNTTGELLLKSAGKFGFDLGASITPGNTALPALASGLGLAGAANTVPLVIGGTAARYLQKVVGRGKVENVLRLIEQGAQNPQAAANLVQAAGSKAKALAALNVLAKGQKDGVITATLNQLKQQVMGGGDKAAATTATETASKGVRLNSRPESAIGAVALSGGIVGADQLSNYLTDPQGVMSTPAQDRWTLLPPDQQKANDVARFLNQAEYQDLPKDGQPTEAPQNDPMAQNDPMQAAAPEKLPVAPLESFLDKMVKVESGGRADAKNPNSSATGVAQFIEKTWLEYVRKYKPELMKGRSKKQVLELRNDPKLSREMAGYKAQENIEALQKAGLPVSDTTLYLAHFLGPTGAKALLTAKVGTPVDKIPALVPAIDSNRSVLKGKKAEDVLRWAQDKMTENEPKPKKKRDRVRYTEAKKKVGVS